jgi:hypothetical protein
MGKGEFEMAVEFYKKLEDARIALSGTHVTEEVLKNNPGGMRWPFLTPTAVVHGTLTGDVHLRKVDCYGWRKCQFES